MKTNKQTKNHICFVVLTEDGFYSCNEILLEAAANLRRMGASPKSRCVVRLLLCDALERLLINSDGVSVENSYENFRKTFEVTGGGVLLYPSCFQCLIVSKNQKLKDLL